MHDYPFFTSDPESNQRTLLFFMAQTTQMWLRMTLHIPYEEANRAADLHQFIPFENTVIPVSSSERTSYMLSPIYPDATDLLEHIEQQTKMLGLVSIHGIHGMHGMHPDAKKCWVETVAEVYRRFGEKPRW